MKRALLWILGVLVAAYVVHLVSLAALPYVIMNFVLSGAGQQSGVNTFLHPPLATHESRQVVRPSPDLAYSSLVFDVSERPLRVQVPLTQPYTSLSGFATNTDNFFAMNDQTTQGADIDVVIVGPSTPRRGLDGLRVIESPSERGLLLVRRVVPTAASFAAIDETRKRASAAPISAGE